MSLSDRMLANGFEVHILAFHGNRFEILDGPKAGTFFFADDATASVIHPDVELGDDLREASVLRCARPAPELFQENILKGLGTNWRIVLRQDNPSENNVDFWAVKIVQGKDQ